jgi:hypothetical protein
MNNLYRYRMNVYVAPVSDEVAGTILDRLRAYQGPLDYASGFSVGTERLYLDVKAEDLPHAVCLTRDFLNACGPGGRSWLAQCKIEGVRREELYTGCVG